MNAHEQTLTEAIVLTFEQLKDLFTNPDKIPVLELFLQWTQKNGQGSLFLYPVDLAQPTLVELLSYRHVQVASVSNYTEPQFAYNLESLGTLEMKMLDDQKIEMVYDLLTQYITIYQRPIILLVSPSTYRAVWQRAAEIEKETAGSSPIPAMESQPFMILQLTLVSPNLPLQEVN